MAKTRGEISTSASCVHPLFLPEVVSAIFQHLGKDDILTARTVCSCWRPIGWRELRKRIVISFRTIQSLESYLKFFTDRFEALLPFNSYKFCFQFLVSCTSISLVTDLFAKFGSNILNVDLQYSNVVLTDELQRLLPALQQLSVSSSRMSFPTLLRSLQSLEIFFEPSSYSICLVRDLLSSQYSLESLKVNAAGTPDTYLSDIIEIIAVTTSRMCESLKILDINFPISVAELCNLSKHNMKLKSLSLVVQNQTTDHIFLTEALHELLEKQTTLQTFQCRFVCCWKPERQFGKFPALTSLKHIALENVSGDLQFLTDCPNLKRISISLWRPELPELGEVSGVENVFFNMPSVTSAEIGLTGFPVVFQVLDYITVLFPNLKLFKFNASITGDTDVYTRLIKQRLPQLTQKSVERLNLFCLND